MMRHRLSLVAILAMLMLGLTACSSDDSSDPSDPGNPNNPGTITGSLDFADYGAAARQVLPPVYTGSAGKAFDIWRGGDFSLLGKVFSEHEPMSIHANIANHDDVMMQIEEMLLSVAEYEAEYGELPSEPIAFDDPQYGSGTMFVQLLEAPAPIAVPSVCQTVFGVTEVAVDYLMHIEVTMDAGATWISPYFGFSASDSAQVLYYWDVNRDETETANGSMLFYATKGASDGAFTIAGATFKPDGPGEEERCNWVYNLTGNDAFEFTYNMGWYSESPEFQLFGCIQGSGDKDLEFGLRYHQYTDTSGWDVIDDFAGINLEIFGPVGDDPYASIDEASRNGTFADYIDESVMYVRDDSPLAEIPNPFAAYFQ